MKRHIRREEHAGMWLWAVYHCLGCCRFGTLQPDGIVPLLFYVSHFKPLKEYTKPPRKEI